MKSQVSTPEVNVDTALADLDYYDDTISTLPVAEDELENFNHESEQAIAQPDTLPVYRASAPIEFDLINTMLDVRFDMAKKHLMGRAEITAAPFAESRRYFTLDAMGFDIHKVEWAGTKNNITYQYDGKQLTLDLGKPYPAGKAIKISIDYTAKPDEQPTSGSRAIQSNKGLYFINADGKVKDKPTQIWTQGETESNSRWFPTIDKPNQRMTQEMYITVEDQYQTLSNGSFLGSKKNSDGTRTDHYIMKLPHAPYLFMMAVGKYAVVKDKWEGIPLQYYVEPEYAADAKLIFNHTPEMLTFFSNILGVKYPWPSFSQIIVRDYVSGAMENTTAVVFGEFIQKHAAELLENNNDQIVAHEMFHHWFGDYVTTESWSNITLNEGFANYSEYLWYEYKYGRDYADAHRKSEMEGYLQMTRSGMHDLIDFTYRDKENMFDAHSYNKGGLVLHMLRDYVGDTVFFKSLRYYLNTHAFQSVEGHDLRLAFEKTSGQDLNWFFNQWFYGSGQPELTLTDSLAAGKLFLTVAQTQSGAGQQHIFRLPVIVDIYYKDRTEPDRKQIVISRRTQTFEIPTSGEVANIIFDAHNTLLATVRFEKSKQELYYQASHSRTIKDKLEVLSGLKTDPGVQLNQVLRNFLKDPADIIVQSALSQIEINTDSENAKAVRELALNHSSIAVRASALSILAEDPKPEYESIFQANLKKGVAGSLFESSLVGLYKIDKQKAIQAAAAFENDPNPAIISAVMDIYLESKDPRAYPLLEKSLGEVDGFDAFSVYSKYSEMLLISDNDRLAEGVAKLGDLAQNNPGSQWRKYSIAKTLYDVATADLSQLKDSQKQMIQSNAKKYLEDMIEKAKGTMIYDALLNFKLD